jgi:hypothetical protein
VRAAAAERAENWRREQRENEERTRPVRRAMMEVSGVPLRDLDAALGCLCGCHPRIDLELHGGGANCPCQQTPEERRAAFDSFLAALPASDPDDAQRAAAEKASFDARAAELEVTATVAVSAAPFVITGTVDGRGFYLRERHGVWRVTIAPDDEPGIDPWAAPVERATLDVASGSDDDLVDPEGGFGAVRALDVAVTAVRTYLRQCACPHTTAPRHARYCPRCGTALIDAAAPDRRGPSR